MIGLVVLALLAVCSAQDWHPLLGDEHSSYHQFNSHPFSNYVGQQQQQYQQPSASGQCDLYKVGFSQDLYFQYIQYKVDVPELKEFTLCFWNKFANHSNDHPVFSYALDGQPRAIYSWVSNSQRSSYYSLSVEGHTLYRLNYPLRLNRWYHTCQSWNGKTGEWQIWVNAERVGRGFHNRLVGHSVPAGGLAISGQEQSQIGGGFLEGKDSPAGAGGMLGEITMVQLYNVALTAGKAHRDHKHHHAHKYDHNGAEITTTPGPTPAPRPPQPSHPLLTGGQLNPNVALTIAAQQPQLVQGQQFNAQYLNGQFASGLVTQQLSNAAQGPQTFQPQQLVQPARYPLSQPPVQFLPPAGNPASYSQQTLSIGGKPLLNSGLVHPTLTNPANVQYIDSSSQIETHNLFKREDRSSSKSKTKRQSDFILAGGHIDEDSFISTGFDQSLLDGLAGIGENTPVLEQQKKMEEREPAEAEVMAVMNICSGCDAEPFAKALVFGWRTVPKKLYAGAVYSQALNECRVF